MPPVTSSGKTKQSVELTDEEREEIWLSLCFRCNMIETGDPILSSQDITDGHKGKINALDIQQMKKLIMLSELKKKVWGI